MASHAVRAPVARPAGALRAPRSKRAARAVRSRAVDADTLESATIDLVLPTDEARVSFQFDKIVVNDQEGPVIFVTGVALGSAAEAAGVVPGQRLVALSDPVNDGDLWFLDGTERLAFVLDAIRSTRQYSTTLVFESEVSITKEMVDRARPPPKEEKEPTAQKQQPRATPEQLGFERPPVERREREDLYSDKWAGDEYVGDGGFGTSSPWALPSSSPSRGSSPSSPRSEEARCGISPCSRAQNAVRSVRVTSRGPFVSMGDA